MPAAGEAPVVLRLEGITRRFGPLIANDAIGFELRRGEVVALLGENGAGKTTLMSILFGHYLADEGSVEVDGRPLPPGDTRAALAAGLAMVHQHFTLADSMSVLENIALGTQPLRALRLDRARALARIREMSADFGLDVDPAARVADLSVGERQRVEILKALYREARILILDEPTAVLTPQESEALFVTLRRLVDRGLAIIFISHKLAEVMAVSDRVLVLRAGRLVGERVTAETDRHALAELMVGAEIPRPDIGPASPGAVLVEMQGVSAGPLTGVDLVLHAGEITGIAGVSGNGQAALADLLSGTRAPEAGSLRIGGREIPAWSPRAALGAGIARIPEDRHGVGVIGDMSVTENLVSEAYRAPAFSRRGWMNWGAARDFARGVIRDYEVKCSGPEARARLLSGGNMQKLILGRAFDGAPQIILASQPTRGLDVGAVAYVHARLLEARARGAAILLISEDLDEIMGLADRIHVISRGRLSPATARGELHHPRDRRAHGGRGVRPCGLSRARPRSRRPSAFRCWRSPRPSPSRGSWCSRPAPRPSGCSGWSSSAPPARNSRCSETLTRATPLIFTGLAVTVAFRAKLWNIGAEAQLYIGGVVTVVLGTGAIPAPAFVLIPLIALAAMLAGGLAAARPGAPQDALRCRRSGHDPASQLHRAALRLDAARRPAEGPDGPRLAAIAARHHRSAMAASGAGQAAAHRLRRRDPRRPWRLADAGAQRFRLRDARGRPQCRRRALRRHSGQPGSGADRPALRRAGGAWRGLGGLGAQGQPHASICRRATATPASSSRCSRCCIRSAWSPRRSSSPASSSAPTP